MIFSQSTVHHPTRRTELPITTGLEFPFEGTPTLTRPPPVMPELMRAGILVEVEFLGACRAGVLVGCFLAHLAVGVLFRGGGVVGRGLEEVEGGEGLEG